MDYSSNCVLQTLIINGITDVTLSSPVWDLLLNRQNTLSQPLGEEVAAPPTVCVSGGSQRFFQWLQKRLLKVFTKLVLLDGVINSSESWLLVIMEDSPVSMENENTLLLGRLTVAAINTVIWTVVPLAGEHIQGFWIIMKYDIKKVLISPSDIEFIFL